MDLASAHAQPSWSDSAEWSGDGIRRSVFYFGSPGSLLYGSMYAAEAPRSGLGAVICPSWGFEVASQQNLGHSLGLRLAGLGGAALVFHPPGHGDSEGDPEEVSMETLASAASEAVAEARARAPAWTWVLAGVRLGAAVAALAAEAAGADLVLAIQPAFDPPVFLEELTRAARRTALVGANASSLVFGHVLPQRLIDSCNRADIGAALAGMEDRRAVVRFERPAGVWIPGGFEDLVVHGEWSPRDSEGLVGRASAWLSEQETRKR